MSEEVFFETDRLVIRRLQDRDVQTIARYRNDPRVAELQVWSSFSESEAEALVGRMHSRDPVASQEWFQFGVARKSDDQLIGDLAFRIDAAEPRQAEVGYSFDPDHQGQGNATEAMRGLLVYAFNRVGLHRVFAMTDPRNGPSIRLLQRLGMRQEAHFREYLWLKDEWMDDLVFAMLDREFVP